MKNKWNWEKINPECYILKDEYNYGIAHLAKYHNDKWACQFYNDDYNITFNIILEGIYNAEEAIWQATLWIYNTCNQVANSFHRIRDHLPDLGELKKRAENYND